MNKNTLIYRGFLGATCVTSICGYSLAANAADLTPVSLELAILIDSSDSIAEKEFYDQIRALNNIFNDGNFYNDFVSPLKGVEVKDPNDPDGKIVIDNPSVAVGVYQFGGFLDDDLIGQPIFESIMDWTVFNEQHQSGAVGLNVNTVDKIGGVTPISSTLGLIINELSNNDYHGHQVVNFSSDGFETFSDLNYLDATEQAYRTGVTFNALVIPALGLQKERLNVGDELYSIRSLRTLVDRYSRRPPERKNNNLVGNPAFIMEDYATGEKTLEEAFRLKLGLEIIGRAPSRPEPTPDPDPDPTPDPDDNLDPGDLSDGGSDDLSDGGPDDLPDGGIDPAEQIPEPSSLLGLLTISLLGLLRHKKKA